MRLKMILVAALALVMVSCGGSGGGNAALQKKSATASFRAISALGPAMIGPVGNLLSNKLRPQAGGTADLPCDSGTGTVTVTSTANSIALVLVTSDAGCTESGTNTKAPGTGLSMSFTGTGDFETSNYSFTLGINGGATITTGSSTEAFTYDKFSIKIDVKNTGTKDNPVITVSIVVNGSVTTTTDGKQTFDNVSYTAADLN